MLTLPKLHSPWLCSIFTLCVVWIILRITGDSQYRAVHCSFESFLDFSQIVKDGKVSFYVNGADVQESNWMRFVNCSRVEDEQNLVAYQYRGEIFYRAYKDIQPGVELLVWYGEQYATHLGINLDGTISDGTTSINGGKNCLPLSLVDWTLWKM